MLDQNAEAVITDLRLLLPLAVTNALHVLAAIAILIIGFWVAGRTQRLVTKSLNQTRHADPMLAGFISNIVRYFVLTITVLAVLAQFGIQTTSLVAVLGAAGLAVGLALQGTLSHVAAGVMLLIFRPFRVGHHVQVSGIDGAVKELSLLWTEVTTSDNVQVIIPNGSVWGQPLRNYSVYPQPAATTQVRFRLPNPKSLDREGLDPGLVQQRIAAILDTNPTVLRDPAPTVLLDHNPTDDTLETVVTFVPAETGKSAAIRSDIIRAVHLALANDTAC